MPQKANSSQSSDQSYSTTVEINTGAKWVNGQYIWKKTIGLTGSLPNQDTTFAHSISGMTHAIRLEGYWDKEFHVVIPMFFSTTNYTAARFDSTNIYVSLGPDRRGSGTLSVTIYYTKG